MSYHAQYHSFTEQPASDSCWSVSTGPDGRIYLAVCNESAPGGVVTLGRYNRETDGVDYLFDLDRKVGDPRDSGRATQCKIHYSFAASPSTGILYMATHLSGPPIDLPVYSPWNFWHNPERCFRGAALLAFDTRTDEVLWSDTLIPKEGCRCLLLDDERQKLYALGYPRDHMIEYDIRTRTRRDLGRIGSVNAQCLFLDRKHRVWTTDDYGHLMRFDPGSGRLERSPYVLPHNPPVQTGWHSVFYDVAASPEGDCVYAVPWNAGSLMMRIWPEEGEWGRVENLGQTTPPHDLTIPENYFMDHAGGLVFGPDGMLYYVASRWSGEMPQFFRNATLEKLGGKRPIEGVLYRLDPKTLKREEVAVLERPDAPSQYVTRGAMDKSGDLYFGHVGPPPVGFFRVTLSEQLKKSPQKIPLRTWG
jgi:hypothetical protein